MNASRQLFEMSLLKVVNVRQSLAYTLFGKNTQFMYRILQRKSLHSPKNRTYLRFFCCRRLVFTLSLSNAKSYILPTNVSFSNGYFPKTTAESMLKFDRWYKTTLFPWYKLRYLISSAKHYAVYKHKAFPPQIQIELTLLLKTNPPMYSNLCLHPSGKNIQFLYSICRGKSFAEPKISDLHSISYSM